jgi:multidrug efflux pump subunit AcrA (membrane-fusion protein)
MLPVVAVQRVSDQYFAFIATAEADGSLVARQRPVDLGPVTGNAYVVRGGLSVGDRLVLSGTQKIGDGVPVQALPSSPANTGAAAGSGQGDG